MGNGFGKKLAMGRKRMDRQRNERADEIYEKLIDTLAHEDKTKEPGAIAFAIWVHLTYFLVDCGWTTDELVKDVTWHSENAEDYWKPVIEPASPEEIAMCDERMKDYEKDPASFAPLKKRG